VFMQYRGWGPVVTQMGTLCPRSIWWLLALCRQHLVAAGTMQAAPSGCWHYASST